MYLVTIQNDTTTTEIQNEHHKLLTGSVVKGINTIDSFTFSILPGNPAFGALKDFVTLVRVYNLAKQRDEFLGRVLYTSPQMDDKGLITQEAICESYFGFLCDSQQEYVAERDWTEWELLKHLIDTHNYQVEAYKNFELGFVEEFEDSIVKLKGRAIQRGNTWDSIKKNLLDVLGGEIRFRVTNGVTYIDYVKKLGEEKSTELALSKNMKSIVKEKNPSAFITRLIPLGAKKDEETEERYDITSVNGGKKYIDDTEGIAEYGLHIGYVEFDDETEPENIKALGEAWLKNNNKVCVKYTITALDLSALGLDVDDFDIYNTYPLKNSLLGIDDSARINRKVIDVCDDTKTSIEIGENFKTLSELQREQVASLGKLNEDVVWMTRNYATRSSVRALSGEVALKVDKTALISEINASADVISLVGRRFSVYTDNLTIEPDGTIKATNADISGAINVGEGGKAGEWHIKNGSLFSRNENDGTAVTITPKEGFTFLINADTGSNVRLTRGGVYYQGDGGAADYISASWRDIINKCNET